MNNCTMLDKLMAEDIAYDHAKKLSERAQALADEHQAMDYLDAETEGSYVLPLNFDDGRRL